MLALESSLMETPYMENEKKKKKVVMSPNLTFNLSLFESIIVSSASQS